MWARLRIGGEMEIDDDIPIPNAIESTKSFAGCGANHDGE
jgi:hypothetical protein